MSQEELLKLIRKKDERAFSHLYESYSANLYSIIYNLIKDREEAEDVLQEVFLKIWKNLESYNESKGRFFTWALNIARNASIDRLRSKDYRKNAHTSDADNFVQMLDNSNRMNNRIDSIGIQEFIRKLKPKCIRLIDLLFFKGYTQQEAADELELPLGTVKTQNRSCINDLRTLLKV